MSIEIFEEAVRSLRTGQKIALCTVVEKVGAGPRGEGTKILVREDGMSFGTIGGGAFERILKQKAVKLIREGRSESLKFSLHEEEDEERIKTGLWCGGNMTVFVDVIAPKPKMVLVGSGHIALPTYKIGELLGFGITVVDNNFETATKDRFPNANIICNENFEAALKEVDVDKNTHILIVYGEPMFDLAALRRFVGEEVAFLGILGSPGKIAKLKERLKKEGVPAEKIEKIKGPIGLDIGAKTPEEIAVSIVAELIKQRSAA
jgi:xanthine dehydrogenase accessory factor